MVNSSTLVSFHHKMSMKRCLEDEIERQLKYTICDVGLCIFGCFKKARFKGEIQLHDAGGEARTYIKQMYVQ
jgi:hypothetical protein